MIDTFLKVRYNIIINEIIELSENRKLFLEMFSCISLTQDINQTLNINTMTQLKI